MKGANPLDLVDPAKMSRALPPPPKVAEFIYALTETLRGCNFRCTHVERGLYHCDYYAADIEEIVAHILAAHDPPEKVDCPYCGYQLRSKTHLSKHVSAKHRQEHKEKKLSLSPKSLLDLD